MEISAKFPNDEKYDLKDNLRRAARSATRNIAEGFGRHHHKENTQHCRISRGSLFELIDDVITTFEEQYIDYEEYNQGRQLIDRAIQLTNGYINYLKNLK